MKLLAKWTLIMLNDLATQVRRTAGCIPGPLHIGIALFPLTLPVEVVSSGGEVGGAGVGEAHLCLSPNAWSSFSISINGAR